MNNSSSAVDYDIFEEIRLEKEKKDRELAEKRQKIMMEKARKNAANKVKVICAVLVIFAISCTVLYRNVSIIQAASKVNALTGELEDLKSINTKKELSLEQSLDLKYVEEVATRKLGMKRPDKFQTVYIDVTQSNYAEVASNAAGEKENFHGAFSVIKQGAVNVLEYLQ